jgi:hypothetical protein
MASKEQSGWLIESYDRYPNGKPKWLRLADTVDGVRPVWVEDSLMAMQFAREIDAANFARLFQAMCCLAKITEHIWFDGPVF